MSTTTTAAPTTCANHPDRAAVDTCFQCGSRICAECRDVVASKAMCHNCVAAIRNRVAGNGVPVTTAPVPPLGAPASSAIPPPLPTLSGSQSAAPPPSPYNFSSGTSAAYQPPMPVSAGAMLSDTPSSGRIAGAIAAGFGVGLVLTILWFMLVLNINFNLSLIAIGIGWLIGLTVRGVAGRPCPAAGIGAGALAFLFTGLGSLPNLLSGGAGIVFALICVFFGTRRAYIVAAAE